MTDAYAQSGVNIDVANDTKKEMAIALEGDDSRVLNKIGAFASLYDGLFAEYKHPVLVFKTEEPGSKQLLALQNNSVETICQDLINHLVNDCIVMGARPLSIQDCIVCGKLDKQVILRMVNAFAKSAQDNECSLTGGETSEQPGVISAGTYILTASITGIVDKDKIIDGSKIKQGDMVIALESSGVHTNGISLVRKIISDTPTILDEQINGMSFMQSVLVPHRAYYTAIKDLFGNDGLVGLAHITGGGIRENLNRILPNDMDAEIDLSTIKILPIFKTIRQFGNISDADMLRTFNMGVGLTAVVKKEFSDTAIAHAQARGINAYLIGRVTGGNKNVQFINNLNW